MFKHLPPSFDTVESLPATEPLEAGVRPFLAQGDIDAFFNQKKRLQWLISLCDLLVTSRHFAEETRWKSWEKNDYNGRYPMLSLLCSYLYLPGVYIHELAHYLTDLLIGSWIGCYPIGFSVYHTESGMGGSVQAQFENKSSSTAYRIGFRLLTLQTPTLVWLALLGGSLSLPFPYNGLSFAWVLLFVPPQSWGDTRHIHKIMTGLLHSIPDTFPLRTKEISLPAWSRIKALSGLTYRVLGWPAFYLKLVLTGIFFFCVPFLKPEANSIQFSYYLEPISFHNELRTKQERQSKAYRQVTARTFDFRYQRHERMVKEYDFFWLLLTKISYLLAQITLWLLMTGLAIVYAGRGDYFLLGYWALYGHFIAGRPGTTWSVPRTVRIISRLIRRRRYQVDIDKLVEDLIDKGLFRTNKQPICSDTGG